jgi:hypothetical protein
MPSPLQLIHYFLNLLLVSCGILLLFSFASSVFYPTQNVHEVVPFYESLNIRGGYIAAASFSELIALRYEYRSCPYGFFSALALLIAIWSIIGMSDSQVSNLSKGEMDIWMNVWGYALLYII